MDQPKRPPEYPEHWYDEFLDGPLKERQQRFLERYGFAHDDKYIVHEEIVELFKMVTHDRDGTYDPTVRHVTLGDGKLVEIPTVLVLALMLHNGFSRDHGGRDHSIVEAKDAEKKGVVYKMRKEEFDYLVSCTKQLVRDPKFTCLKLGVKQTREKAAEDVVKREWPNFTDVEVHVWVQHIISPGVWFPRPRPGRIKKKKPVAM